jgi:hypothetical protein
VSQGRGPEVWPSDAKPEFPGRGGRLPVCLVSEVQLTHLPWGGRCFFDPYLRCDVALKAIAAIETRRCAIRTKYPCGYSNAFLLAIGIVLGSGVKLHKGRRLNAARSDLHPVASPMLGLVHCRISGSNQRRAVVGMSREARDA